MQDPTQMFAVGLMLIMDTNQNVDEMMKLQQVVADQVNTMIALMVLAMGFYVVNLLCMKQQTNILNLN